MIDAQGTFDIKMASTGHAPEGTLQSLSLSKTFHGALEGTSKGEMLASGGPPSANGGYVALERFQGTLAGRSGSFALMHSGVMSQGTAPQLSVTVVPGSGTGDLSGLHGAMTIAIDANRQHTYTLHYGF